MKTFLAALLIAPCAVFAAQPFLVFAVDRAYTDAAAVPVIKQHLLPSDYVGKEAIEATPGLSGVMLPDRQVTMAFNLGDLQRKVSAAHDHGSQGMFLYQWGPSAPSGEAGDPIGSTARAVAIARSGGSRHFGIMPEGQFFGATHCAFNLDSSPYRQVDWKTIDFLDIQGEGLLFDGCAGTSTIQDYMKLVTVVAAFVREKNPGIVIAAQLSFRDTQPANMIQAARELSGVVDGFLLAYPMYSADRRYCNAQNLEIVLNALRPVR